MNRPSIFTSEQILSLDKKRVPQHVAFIPDGNRRWAKNRQISIAEGHHQGSNTIIETVKAAKELGIKVVTFYLFSTENWSRPKAEVNALMNLLESFLYNQLTTMLESSIRLQTIGDLSRLPDHALKAVEHSLQNTSHCNQVDMVLALNYGGRDEMRRAINRLIEDCSQQKIQKNDIDESLISRYLDTGKWVDPDLFIRTSGEMRISNFLLWQLSYTEIYVTDILWPDFTPTHLLEAVLNFQKRERRLGGP